MWNIVWFLLISAMPSWWEEISSGSADSPLGSQLTWASLSCDLGCLWLSVTPKNTEGAGGVHEYVKALPSQKTEKGDADITEKFRKYSRRAGNTTVGWHRAYMNPEFPSTCVAWFGTTPWESPRHADQQLCLCTNPAKLLSSLCMSPTTIFSETCTAQHLLLLFYCLLTWKIWAFTAWFQVVICVLCIYYLSWDVWDL